MTHKVVESYAPGKLYLLGEYAVVNEGNPAIIFGLNKGVHITIKESSEYLIKSSKYDNEEAKLIRRGRFLHTKDRRYRFVVVAINTVLAFVSYVTPFTMEITSELDNEQHKKYGLGSSSALIVATTKAIASYFDLDFSLRDIFKLSAITQYRLSPFTSFGDLAASVYGGCIYYQKGSVNHLKNTRDPRRLLHRGWDDYIIEQLDVSHMNYVIGYTHEHASSTRLVRQVQAIKDSMAFNRFLSDARRVVDEGKMAIITKDDDLLFKSIIDYRKLLIQLSQLSDVAIEIDIIKKMNDVAMDVGGVSKSSGAGGGDCVIALASTTTIQDAIITQWQQLGVEIIRNIQLDV